jgi:hypothetical protein
MNNIKILFSDLYESFFSDIVDRVKVSQTVQLPDKSFPLELGDRKYEFYTKKFMIDEQRFYYVWVLGELKDHTCETYIALAILPTLAENIDLMNPEEILKSFLEQFGLRVQGPHKSTKLLYHDVFWGRVEEPSRFWTLRKPSKTGFLSAFLKIEPHESSFRVESHLVFAVDMDKYRSWLQTPGL